MENLWNDAIPYWNEEFIEADETAVRKPTITAYPANSKGAVIIFPGGGYVIRADHEGTAYAKWLQSIGLTAFVVEYRVAPYKHPAEISDAMRAVKYVRYYADKYGIDKDKIAVMGSSAGGHLAASVSVHYDKKMYEDTKALFDKLEIDVDPKRIMSTMPVSQRQMAEIAKAVSFNSKIIVFDEPTSSLTEEEVEHLFKIINMLRDQGCGIIYISHKMAEILRISDDITVMRDGTWVATKPAKEMTMDEIIRLMVGRELTNQFPPKTNKPGEVALEVENLTAQYSLLRDVSFKVRRGEIVGLAGLDGSGRTETLENIFGIATRKSGTIKLDGKVCTNRNARESIKNGFALLTEERRATGIFGILSIRENTVISSLKKHKKKGLYLSEKSMREDTQWSIDAMHTKTPTQETKIRSLSGGNQQKVILGRWLLTNPEYLILDEPTRGIDIGTKTEIQKIVLDLADQGMAVTFISSEVEEMLRTCSRMAVLRDGEKVGELEESELSQSNIMKAIAGGDDKNE